MKFLAVFGVLCLVAYSTQVALFEGCDENVENFFDKESCIHVKCALFKNETFVSSKMLAKSCPISTCRNGTEFKGETPMDVTKVYPDCCIKAICE